MILPTKRLSASRSLLFIGAEILSLVDQPKTVSRLWRDFQSLPRVKDEAISYDWFVLGLDLLFSISAIDLKQGKLIKTQPGK